MSSTLVSRANRYMLRSTPDLNTLAARPPTVSYIPTHHCQLAPTFGVANDWSGHNPGNTRHGWKVADVAVHDPKQDDDRGLVCGDAVEVAHPADLIDQR